MLYRAIADWFRKPFLPGIRVEDELDLQRLMFWSGVAFLAAVAPFQFGLTWIYNNHIAAWVGFALIYVPLTCSALWAYFDRTLFNFEWPLRWLHGGHFLGLLVAALANISIESPSFWWLTVTPLVALLSGLTSLGVIEGLVVVMYALAAYLHPDLGHGLDDQQVRRHTAAILSTTYASVYLGLATVWRQRLQAALAKAHRDVEVASMAKARFLANMSHEIRTPLYSVIGAIELLRSDRSSEAQRAQLLSMQEQSAKTLLGLINDVLDWSKLDAGKVEIHNEKVDLRALVFDSNELFAISAFEKQIELTSSSDPDVPRAVSGDGMRIRQIVNNLVSNAVKFTERGGVHIHLSRAPSEYIPADADDSKQVWICIAVSDTGIGISENRLEAIFAPFTQADSSVTRRYGGTGLGLAICQELATLMAGRIIVRSAVESGSTFKLMLPLHVEPGEPKAVPGLSTGDETLLVCEDPGLVRHLLSLCSELRINGQVISHLPLDGELANFKFILIDAPLLARLPNAKEWVAAVVLRGIRLAVMTPLTANLAVNTLEHKILYKPIGHRSLAAFMSNNPDDYQREMEVRLGRAQFTGKRILVAEDNTVNQLIVERMLEMVGATCVLASNGYEALERMKAETFDLVLMDMEMPEMDGLTATRRWRAGERNGPIQSYNRMPIIAMTANMETEQGAVTRAAGMDDFIAKPFTSLELVKMLHLHIKQTK